jgi:chemotaxis protein CheC
MSELSPEVQPPRLDRARELASIGAGHAAGALARLVNRTIWMDAPRVQPVDAETVPRAAALAEDGTAIFFELQGGVGGMMAVVFSRASLEVIVTEMMGAEAYELESAVESAVREAGNMLVSHYASAIADTLGTVVLPSIPVLTEEAVPAALGSVVSWRAGEPERLLLESPIYDGTREVQGYLVLVLE